jgi:ABC-type polysaccharide/polyol phosphate transport system ATPase subunit
LSLIHLNNVSLDYILKTGSESFKKTLMHKLKPSLSKSSKRSSIGNSSFRALTDINMRINYGDRVGLIGRNGAGKSTLLRVLAKIYQPTCGSLSIKGNITNLFDLNLGLDIEASGYENIVSLGIMRGLSKREARGLIADVEEFTELGDFLDAPVRTYSSGMQMKLAFAVATAGQPEIILIDEVIGVGDSHFIAKAQHRLQDLVARSHVLVLASHSDAILKQLCNKVAILDKGHLQFFGDLQEGLDFYNADIDNESPAPVQSAPVADSQQEDVVTTA